jgi:hypothetical protein
MDIKDMDRPWQVFCVLDGEESFYSGHIDKGIAEYKVEEANKRAVELGIKARYILKDCTPKVKAPESVIVSTDAPATSEPPVPGMSVQTAQALASATGQAEEAK